MVKLRKKVAVVLSVFIVITILGSIIAITRLRAPKPETDKTISSDIGYFGPGNRGSGVFAQNEHIDTTDNYDVNNSMHVSNYGDYHSLFLTYDSVDETKNTFLRSSICSTSDGNSTNPRFGWYSSCWDDGRTGIYQNDECDVIVAEFDLRIPKYVYNDASSAEQWFLRFDIGEGFGLSNRILSIFFEADTTTQKYNAYLKLDSPFDSYDAEYEYLPLGYSFDYDEWYNIRVVVEQFGEGLHTENNVAFYVNNDLNNRRYQFEHVVFNLHDLRTAAFVPRPYAYGLKVDVDNFYFAFE